MIQNQPPRQFFKLSVLFFQEQPFYNFPGESICSSSFVRSSSIFRRATPLKGKRHGKLMMTMMMVYLFVEQTCFFFSGGSIYVHRTDTNFPGRFIEQTLLSHRTDTNFPRNPYLVLEHIRDLLTKYLFERGHLPGKLYVVEN